MEIVRCSEVVLCLRDVLLSASFVCFSFDKTAVVSLCFELFLCFSQAPAHLTGGV